MNSPEGFFIWSLGQKVSLLGPCCCSGCFVKSPEGFFKSYGHWRKRVLCWGLAAVFGCFVKSPEDLLHHVVIGAEVLWVGALLLCWGGL